MVQQHNRHLLADCPMGTFFVVVPTPNLHLFLRVCKVQEPMSVGETLTMLQPDQCGAPGAFRATHKVMSSTGRLTTRACGMPPLIQIDLVGGSIQLPVGVETWITPFCEYIS